MNKMGPASVLANNYKHLALCVALATTGLLVGCHSDTHSATNSDTHSAAGDSKEAAGIKLPYDLYMPGTIRGDWAHNDKTLMKWDAERGVYYFDNIKAGGTSDGNKRRFKLTGPNWTHQFGMAPNGDATPEESSSVIFDGDTAMHTLDEYADSKDIFLSLAEDETGQGSDVLLDVTVKVLDESLDQVALTVHKDLPPIPGARSLTLKLGETVSTMPYVGDGKYQGALLLEADSENSVTIATPDDSVHYQFGSLSEDQTQPVSECSDECSSTLKAGDRFYYQVTLTVAADGSKTVSLRQLDLTEAKAVAPHFDADGTPENRVFAPYAWEWDPQDQTVMASVKDKSAALRTFTLSSDAPQRDNGPSYRVFTETADQPRLHSGDQLFDALFAQAIDDMKLNSVNQIRDGSYNGGDAISCDCFQTGEKWTYVWTRDLSYAANLALANMDPERVVNSMLFKTSAFRPGLAIPSTLPQDSTQIIQDTGSGGSWPVSTDRVSWALAAGSVLNSLSGAALDDFGDKAYQALRGTVEADRQAAFDSKMGLYGGEQSYMDWRTQTYAPWITSNLSHMAESKALSTNVVHYEALRLTAKLAEQKGDSALAAKYNGWADALKQAINDTFWLEDAGLYATMTTAGEDPAPVHKYDMLGTALVVLSGIAPADRAAQAMSHYPHGRLGVPVYYPQQPDVAPYHNRALWPFVTAYAARAAAQVENTAVVDNAINSLVRGAALNLSNMENLEWLSGKPDYSGGPIINSRRQLWSVAGYLDMVMGTLFGYHVVEDGIQIKPFLTSEARKLFGDTNTVTLENVNYKGHVVNVQLMLPAVTDEPGYYPVDNISFAGQAVAGDRIAESAVAGAAQSSTIVVTFGSLTPAAANEITLIDDEAQLRPWDHDERVYSPRVPVVDAINPVEGKFTVDFSDSANVLGSVSYNIYRDGQLVAQNLSQSEGTMQWSDSGFAPVAGKRYCYAVEARYLSSGNYSLHSEPVCNETDASRFIGVDAANVSSNVSAGTDASITPQQPVLAEWGEPADQLSVGNIQIEQAGNYAIQLVYNNAHDDISTGVINAVKTLIVRDAEGQEISRGVVQMPSVQPQNSLNPLRTSTTVQVSLQPGTYSLELEDYFNMSYLQSNATLSKAGGQSGPLNKATLAGFKLVALPDQP